MRLALLFEVDGFVDGRLRMEALLEGRNVSLVFQSQTDIVESLEEHRFAEIINIKMKSQPLRIANGLTGKIGGELITFVRFCTAKEFVHLRIRQSDGKNAIFEAIVIKNVREAWRDDHAEAVIEQRPRRMFAA